MCQGFYGRNRTGAPWRRSDRTGEGQPHDISGVDLKSGRTLWRRALGERAGGTLVFAYPHRTEEPACAHSICERAPSAGRWRAPRHRLPPCWAARCCPPAVSGGTVYAATGESCAALTLAGGVPRRVWQDRAVLGLSADAAGWYARTAKTVRAYNRVV